MLKLFVQVEECQLFPAELVPNDNKSSGRVLPKGTIANADVYMSDDEHLQLVRLFDDGASCPLSSWDIPSPVVLN